jgi:hypothetical protein
MARQEGDGFSLGAGHGGIASEARGGRTGTPRGGARAEFVLELPEWPREQGMRRVVPGLTSQLALEVHLEGGLRDVAEVLDGAVVLEERSESLL